MNQPASFRQSKRLKIIMIISGVIVGLFLVLGLAVLVLSAGGITLKLDGPSTIELHGQQGMADFTFMCQTADNKCEITKCAVSVAEPVPDPYNIDVSDCSCSGGQECSGGCQVGFPAGIYETYVFKLNGEDSCGNKEEYLHRIEPVDTTCELEKNEGGWEDFCDLLGQKRRTVTLINADCTRTSGREVEACETMKTPVITDLILRLGWDKGAGKGGGYEDLFVDKPVPHSIEASFGPLSSVMVVQGNYFYNFTQFPATSEQDLDMRTFTEVWMGQIQWGGVMTAVKTAGVGLCNMPSCSDNGAVNFSAGPWLAPPNDIVVPFYSDPFCKDHINSKDCVMYPRVRGLVPECTKDLQLRAVVNSKTYVIDYNQTPPQWKIISERTEFPGQSGVFVVVPSTVNKVGGYPFVMRGARFDMNRANREILNRFNVYLDGIGAEKYKAPVGLPMSFTTEYDYEEDPFAGGQWVPGEYVRTQGGDSIRRYCDLGYPPNLDEKVCTKDQAARANCYCGFGRRRYPDDYTKEFTKIMFSNGGYDGQWSQFFRPEKAVDLFEVGKPFQPFKIFPLVPFVDENAKPGVVRLYMCGKTNGLDIGFIESAYEVPQAHDDDKIDYLRNPELFHLLYEPFGVSRLSPFWGYPEEPSVSPLSLSSSTILSNDPWLNTAAAAVYAPALSIAAAPVPSLKIIKVKPSNILLQLKKLDNPYAPGEILIRFKQAIECGAECRKADKAALDKLLAGKRVIKTKSGLTKIILSKSDDFNKVLNDFRQSYLVESASPNYLLFIEDQPNDPGFSSLWGLHNTGQTGGANDADIDALEAWDLEDGNSSEVVVAVIDTGVDYTHPDLADNIWINEDEIPDNDIDDDNNGFIDDVRGWDFSTCEGMDALGDCLVSKDRDNDPMDDHYHGTHVAGTIGAIGNNNQGIIGINPHVKIMAVKFLNKDGMGTNEDAIDAIAYATQNGARIINGSFGGGKYVPELLKVIQDFQEQSGLFIAAAGNQSSNNDFKPYYPASYEADNVIAVAASDHNDNLAVFSNYGVMGVDLSAPGTGIFSTVPGNAYAYLDGTSMATPHVSGAAALFWSAYPTWTYNQVKRILLENTDVKDSLLDKVHSSGRLNIYNALKFVLEDPLIWGYNLNPISGNRIQAKIDTWQGERDIEIIPEGKSVAAIKFLDDDLHPSNTALSDLKKICREGYCTKLHQDMTKIPYHPVEFGAPQIEDVTSLENWQAKPFPINEDLPYVENFCAGAQAVIEAEDPSRGFGNDSGRVWLWQDSGWGEAQVASWSNERVTIKIEGSFFDKSADCALEPKTLADISNFKPPAKVCDISGACRVSDQKLIRIIPPPRARLIESSAPEQDRYCMNDRILILGSGFGEERLGAKITIRGEEAARYIKWSEAEIIITPPERYSMWRSPFCPRTDEQNKHGLLVMAEADDPVTITCPGLPSGSRDCIISEIKLVKPYEFEPIPVYHRNPEYAYFTNICLKDEIEINTSFNAGDERGNNIVEFWSNEDGWHEADSYLEWTNNKIRIMPPQVSVGRTSPNCPRQNPHNGEVSIFKGPLRARVGGEYYYISLDQTNVGNKIAMHKEVLVNKNYLIDEEVKITGRYFSEIRSEDEIDMVALPNPLDRRNTGYVEFFTEDLGWAPAGEYIKWSDNEIIVKPPKISVEEEWEWQDKTTVTLNIIGAGAPPSGKRTPVDIVFALDSSGSMTWNDPSDLRKKASVAMLGLEYDSQPCIPSDPTCIVPLDPSLDPAFDQVGVVSWGDHIADITPIDPNTLSLQLTDNFNSAKDAIKLVSADQWTDLDPALLEAVKVLTAGKRPDATWAILFLTDGEDNDGGACDYQCYRGGGIQEAIKEHIVVYTIGLTIVAGSQAEKDLQWIANDTGGKYYQSVTADNLAEVFQEISGEIIKKGIVAEDITVTDVLQPYIKLYEPPNFTIAPTSIDEQDDGTTILTWNPDPNELRFGDEWSVSFDVSSDQAGYDVEVNVYDLSKVDYTRTIDEVPESASTNFPHLKIDVRDPATGEVVCGQGPMSVAQNPLNTATAGKWTLVDPYADWGERSALSVVFNGKMWIINGWQGGVQTAIDVWYSEDGISWTLAAKPDNEFGTLLGSALVFKNKIWKLGGNRNLAFTNDVWFSADGLDWQKAPTPPWGPKQNPGAVVFKNKIWTVGGDIAGDVWYSEDGLNWNKADDPPWQSRGHHGVIVFTDPLDGKEKIWVMGGILNGQSFNDVWYSEDGRKWTQAFDAGWTPREAFGSVVFHNKIWVIGGGTNSLAKMYNEVWYSEDGRHWTQSPNADWVARRYFPAIVFDNKIWIFGGEGVNIEWYSDVWNYSEDDTPVDPNLPHLDTEKSAIPTCILLKGTTENPIDVGREAISIAKQPIRVCTKYGCSTNIVNFRKPEITETIDLGACVDIKGFSFGVEKESGLGTAVYRTGDWWKQALIPEDPDKPGEHLWKDTQVRACFQPGDSAQIILLCRADERCVYWDLSSKQEITWHYPEAFAISPLCVDTDAPGDKLVTLYGQDLERHVLQDEHIIEIDNNRDHPTRIKAKIYDDPIKLFKQQYQDKLVLVIPGSEINKINLPAPGGRYSREHQAVIGKIFLQTKFAQKEEIEITSSLTFSRFCNTETECIDSPLILETNEKSYVDEDRDKGKGRAAGSRDGIVTTAQIKGCNLILDQGTQIVFGDILQYRDLAPISNWDREEGKIEISTPFGAKSGLLSANIWTGLLEYPGIWLTDMGAQPRKTLAFNVLPTIDELGARLGVSGQIAEIYGSDFCGALGCGDFLKDVYLGVWQKEGSTDFDLKGAPAKFFDVSPRMVRIKVPRESDFKTYGDMYANMDKMAVSGQPWLKRGDDIISAPIIKTAGFNAEEFFEDRQYFTKTPVLKEVLPQEISIEEQKRNSPYFKGADYYGYDNTPEQLVFKTPFREFTHIPHGELVFEEPYDALDVDIYERWQYPDLLDLERDSYKRVPEHYFSFSEADRQPYLNNPQGVILSNWDGTFTAWLEGIYKDPAKRPVYSIKSAKEQQCTVQRSLSQPSSSDLPAVYQKGDLSIYKIDHLPLLDVCYYCQDQEITIIGQDSADFGDDKGKVYFWSDDGWTEVEIISWEHKIDEKDLVKVRLEDAQDVKHNQCSGSKNLTKARLPLKLCRNSAEEECAVWYGPNTHVKLEFESGGVNPSYKRTLGRFNRLNLAPSSVFGGDNLAEKVFINEGKVDEGCKITVNVPILDMGIGVKDANVSGTWSGAYSADVSGITNNTGIASFQTGSVSCHGTFTFTVTSVAKANWLYDPSSNIEITDSITLP